MKIGSGLALICVGAILAFAVTANTSFFNLHTAGWVLMIIGVFGLLLPNRTYGWLGIWRLAGPQDLPRRPGRAHPGPPVRRPEPGHGPAPGRDPVASDPPG